MKQLAARVSTLPSPVAVVISGMGSDWAGPLHDQVRRQLDKARIDTAGEWIGGAGPNSPIEDVQRLADEFTDRKPAAVLSIGGGSGIDAVKAAMAVSTLRGLRDLQDLLGSGQVSASMEAAGKTLPKLMAVQLAASSASHLTKYANVTDVDAGQKMLIIDTAVVPDLAMFDYAHTTTMSPSFTRDGGLDGFSHCWEVLMGATGRTLEDVREISLLGIELIVCHLQRAVADGDDLSAREAVGLGTDLGGEAIMIGGTNGGHLTSFSLVDLLPHGRACALMNPYYTVLFAEAIEEKLRDLAGVLGRCGVLKKPVEQLSGRDLGEAVARAMIRFSESIGFPTTLEQVEGFDHSYIGRALAAAKNPKLASKLQNMPIPMTCEQVDTHMASVLEAAVDGDLGKIRSMQA